VVRQGGDLTADEFWAQWRERQRFEQFQDTILNLGHSGYLPTVRRALYNIFAANGFDPAGEAIEKLMQPWRNLHPFPETGPALKRLASRYRLAVLSNGELDYLQSIVDSGASFPFTEIMSVDTVGVFKPHPAVYRRAALDLGLRVDECMMVSSHPFDLNGALTCGFRGAYVDRYGFPYTYGRTAPDLTVKDFTALADAL
jgi:2-haloacid dehalogenase